jgi:hypothetical protein
MSNAQKLVFGARRRAQIRNVPFNLELKDIQIPEICPVLGIPLRQSRRIHSPGSPTIDRLFPSKGYVKGNVRVISHRANTIKHDATAEELKKVYEWVERETRG